MKQPNRILSLLTRGAAWLGLVAVLGLTPASVLAIDLAALEARVAADETPREMLERMSDDFGGRLSGSPANHASRHRLIEELRELGLEAEEEPFMMPGWVRGPDEVVMLEPVARRLRVAAMAYSEAHPRFAAEVVHLGLAREEDYPAEDVSGRVGLVDAGTPLRGDRLAALAAERGLRGLLFTNREGGGQVLARTGNFHGHSLAVPVYSVSQEEGRWMQRLLARGRTVTVTMETHSYSRPVEAVNLSVTLPGRSAETVVVGAHFDTWELGQGAIDNGLGVAQLYALARHLRDLDLPRTVELVWLDGEEQGLWGSRVRSAATPDAPIVAMLNLDMVGDPRSVNALGADELLPVLESWQTRRGDEALPDGVVSLNWLGSDHIPYQLAGVRTITFGAPINREAVRYYHDYADTIDKVYPGLLNKANGIIASLVVHLAQDTTLTPERRDPAAIREAFTRFGLEGRLEAVGITLPAVD